MKAVKWLALILTAAVLLGLMAGCGAGEDAEDMESGAESAASEMDGGTAAEVSFDETVLADNDDIAVTVKTFNPNDQRGPTFTVLLENRTETNLYFTMTNVSVNDVMNDPVWGESVPAGETVSSDIYWYPEDMLSSGIHYVEEVEALLWVYDSADYAAQDVYEGAVHWSVTNTGTDLPATEQMVYDGSFEPVEIFSGDITAYLVDYSAEGEWGPFFTVYLENNSDADVLLAMTGAAVNGVSCDPYWNEDVNPGKIAYSRCVWWDEDLAENGIDQIETVEFTVRAIDYDGWQELASVTMTVSVEGTGKVLNREGDREVIMGVSLPGEPDEMTP